MRKQNKQLTITCIVLSIIILFLLGYIVFLKTTKEEKTVKDEITEKESSEEKAFDLEKANLLLEEFGFNRRAGCETILQKEYDDNFKSIVVLEKLLDENSTEEKCSDLFTEKDFVETPEPMYKSVLGVCHKNKSVPTITYNDANQLYKKMYNEDMPTLHVNGLKNNSMDYVLFEFIKDRAVFAKLDFYGVGGACMSNHVRALKSATQIDNIVKINVYDYESGYVDLVNDTYTFTTDKFTTEIKCSSYEQCRDIIKNKYLHYLDEYEITFEIVNNYYIFKSFNKVV